MGSHWQVGKMTDEEVQVRMCRFQMSREFGETTRKSLKTAGG